MCVCRALLAECSPHAYPQLPHTNTFAFYITSNNDIECSITRALGQLFTHFQRTHTTHECMQHRVRRMWHAHLYLQQNQLITHFSVIAHWRFVVAKNFFHLARDRSLMAGRCPLFSSNVIRTSWGLADWPFNWISEFMFSSARHTHPFESRSGRSEWVIWQMVRIGVNIDQSIRWNSYFSTITAETTLAKKLVVTGDHGNTHTHTHNARGTKSLLSMPESKLDSVNWIKNDKVDCGWWWPNLKSIRTIVMAFSFSPNTKL